MSLLSVSVSPSPSLTAINIVALLLVCVGAGVISVGLFLSLVIISFFLGVYVVVRNNVILFSFLRCIFDVMTLFLSTKS